MAITAKVIADSISVRGKRITTFELEYPRFIHCFHPDTEFLSQISNEMPRFRKYDAIVHLGASIAQYSTDEKISFVQPRGAIKRKADKLVIYDGKLNIAVTEEHRMFSYRRTTNNTFIPHIDLARDWISGFSGARRIPQAGYLAERSNVDGAEAALIAYYVADGHKSKIGNDVIFHLRKKRKIDHILSLLKELNIAHKVKTYDNDTVISFYPPSWVEDCYDESGNKKYPEYIWNMDESAYNRFKHATLLSDGNHDNNEINTTSETAAHQLQIMALLNGDAMNVSFYGNSSSDHKGIFKQKYQQTNYVSFRPDRDTFELIEYSGDVVCFSVPTSLLVVRLNGKAFISGNCEFMTHRLFSRNAASSRAIPVKKAIELVQENTAMPSHWGKNQPGMSAKEECVNPLKYDNVHPELVTREEAWGFARDAAIFHAKAFNDAGYHKQLVNRILEPFTHIKVICTATEFDNFFWLRNHADAQPEIKKLAEAMLQALEGREPVTLQSGQWHMPYYDNGQWIGINGDGDDAIDKNGLTVRDALAISSSCCAQVSYRKLDDSLEKARDIFKRLVEALPPHFSPFEHQATPMRLSMSFAESGVTHMDRYGKFWSGNFNDWIQFRQLLMESMNIDYMTSRTNEGNKNG